MCSVRSVSVQSGPYIPKFAGKSSRETVPRFFPCGSLSFDNLIVPSSMVLRKSSIFMRGDSPASLLRARFFTLDC
ncbi:hypothetical protein E2C01_038948 [Portunus trituberculatus]|uniref:Uncharacterized protein n=1 Tax=Portunus trituberculatus TaxID=210409 RepID=A0A5B7FJD4_PORTR|nr:hypothetical protein [Portunus trituberculatus]